MRTSLATARDTMSRKTLTLPKQEIVILEPKERAHSALGATEKSEKTEHHHPIATAVHTEKKLSAATLKRRA